MNKEFIPYEPSFDLKELGFNEECLAFYNSTFQTPNELLYPQYGGEVGNWNVENHLISAPLYQQAFRWFIEKHDLFGCIDLQACSPSHWFIRIDKIKINDYLYHSEDENVKYNTYEEAELACLKKLIEIIKNK